IRERAGLEGVLDSWRKYSRLTNKPTTKDGLREIIHRERTIEMAFEGQRYWELRRWKTAMEELNQPITGLDVDQETTEAFNRQRVIFDQSFSWKDYFTPLRENDLLENKNLAQNPAWAWIKGRAISSQLAIHPQQANRLSRRRVGPMTASRNRCPHCYRGWPLPRHRKAPASSWIASTRYNIVMARTGWKASCSSSR